MYQFYILHRRILFVTIWQQVFLRLGLDFERNDETIGFKKTSK